jgi:thiamine biosynthesis protein ThiS
MIKVTLSPHLRRLLSEESRVRPNILLHAGTWSEITQELRDRHPVLANRVIAIDGKMVTGFVLVINDRIVQSSEYETLRLFDEDEIIIITTIAGGCPLRS